MRKSQVLQKEVAGNTEKYNSYREAWSRIKLAQEHGFYLEAIAIQESIISDRLISYLHSKQEATFSVHDKNFPSFNKLIKKWRSKFSSGLSSGNYSNLIDEVDQWRLSRNQIIHAIVKSKPSEPTQSIDLFLYQAKEAAKTGEAIAREVCNWSKNNKRNKKF
ncbi:hypothetical protein [Pleurocapsa sp. FMAR1]|uniref:hypothetical protein n=1 Tax=Pleurocapsa sp. FMAR1 TaxID=3040204 RepID=UPI0029C68135|nr:hypothetical protein [Pleurocapsa sp. FMAR1]